MKHKVSWSKRATLSLIFFLIFSQDALAQGIEKAEAVRAIMGEASNQGRQGMLHIACAIRNRGTLKGVYGVNSKHIDNEPQYVWRLAEEVWLESQGIDTTNGATHWENIQAYGEPYWVKSMEKTIEYKDHVFYKEK